MTTESAAVSGLALALNHVRFRVAAAARKSRRPPEEIDILAVTKTVPFSRMEEALTLGINQFGESKVQETLKKKALFRDRGTTDRGPRWHLVGHLQTNKARRAVELFDCIQSLDSLKLAETLAAEGERRAQPVSCLVEVKVSTEGTKQGISPDHVAPFLEQVSRMSFLRLEGMMGMAPFFKDPEQARPYFAALRSLFDRNRGYFSGQPILSMGMSNDFDVAIEEGSTMIRIGTALFGTREKPA